MRGRHSRPPAFWKHCGRLGLIPLLAALAACSPPAPQPSATATTGQPSSTASSTASPTGSPTSSQQATPPADADETTPPQSGDKVISSSISHGWGWPGAGSPFAVSTHQATQPVAPLPESPLPYLYSIGVGQHPSGSPAYDQMSFRFKGGFPSYEIEYVPELIQDGSGKTIPMPGTASIVRVVFHDAQAHLADGKSSIVSAPPESVGYKAITSYAQGGDFEGYVSYGIGVGRPTATVPQTKVQVYEVEKIEEGQHLYVVALQIDATPWK